MLDDKVILHAYFIRFNNLTHETTYHDYRY